MERKYRHITPPSSEITPKEVYLNRRAFLKTMGIVTGGALLTACAPQAASQPEMPESATKTYTDELGNPANRYEEITNYNNYFEFTTDKEDVARLAANFDPGDWKVEVTGLVNKPRTFGLEDLLKFEQKERVYRLRCVEAWSMVIPWIGFELGDLLRAVEPMGSARFVKMQTLMDPDQMPRLARSRDPWPYTEGLRLDEAMHPLTLIATGLYGEPLPNQSGAPIRLVVPWKYGFKSVKAIVRIELTETMPATFWPTLAPQEYGFYANVNPEVDHPRWSQRTERRIGELGRRETLMFNGYESEVASLYSGMDLTVNY